MDELEQTQVAPDPPSPGAQVTQLCNKIRREISPMLAQPKGREVPKQQRRPRQKRPPVTSPWRSVRLAKGGRGSKASKPQAIIIRKLCLANEGDQISDEALEAYARLFDKPLLDSQIQAILALFGWEPSCLPLQSKEGEMVDGQ